MPRRIHRLGLGASIVRSKRMRAHTPEGVIDCVHRINVIDAGEGGSTKRGQTSQSSRDGATAELGDDETGRGDEHRSGERRYQRMAAIEPPKSERHTARIAMESGG